MLISLILVGFFSYTAIIFYVVTHVENKAQEKHVNIL